MRVLTLGKVLVLGTLVSKRACDHCSEIAVQKALAWERCCLIAGLRSPLWERCRKCESAKVEIVGFLETDSGASKKNDFRRTPSISYLPSPFFFSDSCDHRKRLGILEPIACAFAPML